MKISGLIGILIFAPVFTLEIFTKNLEIFLINTSSKTSLIVLFINEYCQKHDTDILTIGIDILSFLLALTIFFFIYMMKPNGNSDFSFSLSTFLISVIMIPFFIDLYFKYYEINMTYMEFFYPIFYKYFSENLLSYFTQHFNSEQSITLIKIYSKTFSHLFQIKKDIFEYFHQYYVDLFIILIFLFKFLFKKLKFTKISPSN